MIVQSMTGLPTYQPTAAQSYSANTFAGVNGAAFTPQRGVLYQVVVNVYRTYDGSSLGYFSSGSSQVLVA